VGKQVPKYGGPLRVGEQADGGRIVGIDYFEASVIHDPIFSNRLKDPRKEGRT
jgi:hypothetical protein